jgi:hypothetical protein
VHAEASSTCHTTVAGGLLAEECGGLLTEFFAARRRESRPANDA